MCGLQESANNQPSDETRCQAAQLSTAASLATASETLFCENHCMVRKTKLSLFCCEYTPVKMYLVAVYQACTNIWCTYETKQYIMEVKWSWDRPGFRDGGGAAAGWCCFHLAGAYIHTCAGFFFFFFLLHLYKWSCSLQSNNNKAFDWPVCLDSFSSKKKKKSKPIFHTSCFFTWILATTTVTEKEKATQTHAVIKSSFFADRWCWFVLVVN